jgi:hypothetical protein
VFPTIDPDIPVLAAGRARLEAAGAKVMVVFEWAARMCADKILTYKLFCDLEVPVPTTWTAPEARVTTLDFPMFVKPRSGSAGKHAVRVRDARELEFFLDYVPDPLVQTYLEGPEITSDVICGAQGDVLAVVSRRRIAVRAGEVAKGVTVTEPEILEHCVSIAKGLKAIDPITVQCLLHEGRPRRPHCCSTMPSGDGRRSAATASLTWEAGAEGGTIHFFNSRRASRTQRLGFAPYASSASLAATGERARRRASTTGISPASFRHIGASRRMTRAPPLFPRCASEGEIFAVAPGGERLSKSSACTGPC